MDRRKVILIKCNNSAVNDPQLNSQWAEWGDMEILSVCHRFASGWPLNFSDVQLKTTVSFELGRIRVASFILHRYKIIEADLCLQIGIED